LILPQPAGALAIWEKASARKETFAWGVRNGFEIALAPADQTEGWLHHETIHPQCTLWIAGSGHIAQAVAPLAAKLDFHVTVFDDRPALANPQYFPKETDLRVDYWERLLKERLPVVPTFGLIVTRGHQHDAMVLREWIQQPFAFLGMIGSKRKKKIIFSHFVEEGIATEEQLQQVACPVGLDIDAVSVEEIGISIASQLVQKRAAIRSAE
jgi:xanthine dehydrogenase accessory factor